MAERIKVLFFGAGVIGSLYAAKLAAAGHDVTVLARGKRLVEIKERGLVLKELQTEREEVIRVEVVERIEPEDTYDYIIVAVRRNQVRDVLPLLATSSTGTMVFMVNTALGYDEYVAALGKERIVAGFPAAAGNLDDGVVHYFVPSGLSKLAQATTIGELDGSRSERVRRLARMFSKAGFNTVVSGNMDAWQRSHVVVVGCIAHAIYLHNGSNYELARSRPGVKLMIEGIREGFAVLKRLGYAVTPPKLRFLEWMPLRILVPFFQRLLDTRLAEIVIAFHAAAARDEMKMLSDEIQVLISRSGLATPSIDALNQCWSQMQEPPNR